MRHTTRTPVRPTKRVFIGVSVKRRMMGRQPKRYLIVEVILDRQQKIPPVLQVSRYHVLVRSLKHFGDRVPSSLLG